LRLWTLIAWLAILVLTLSACAAPEKTALHSLIYVAAEDSPNQTLLAYRYGPADPARGWSVQERAGSLSLPRIGVSGYLPVPEVLYVKWRSNASGREHEQTIDLRGRLPADLDGRRIGFILDEGTASVWIESLEGPRPGEAFIGPRSFRPFQGIRIAP
jgi:hypothetical protein